MNTMYVKKGILIHMLKIHVTLHLMLEVRNKDYVNCITNLHMYTFVGVLCISLRFYQFT